MDCRNLSSINESSNITIITGKNSEIIDLLSKGFKQQPPIPTYEKNDVMNEKNSIHKIAVDTKQLMLMLSCGRKTTIQIGTEANAKIRIGRRVLWNLKSIQTYLDNIAE